jgi:hypothetical protein
LLRQQPVHRLIEFILSSGGVEVEEFPKRAAEGIGVKSTRGSEFGGGFQNAGHDHGHDQIEFAAGMLVEESVELQPVQGAEDSGNMAMRSGAEDIEGEGKRGAHGSGAFQDGAKGLDLSRRPMREVGEGAVENLAVETEGLAEEDGGWGIAVGDGGHVHVYIIHE